jgi:hypothetical protein
MKAGVRSPDRWFRCLTTAFVFAFAVIPSIAFAAGLVDQSIDAAFNLHDQLQAVVMKSVKGVGEAMQEGPPPDNSARPWTLNDLKQIQQKNANLLNLNNNLYQNQQKLADVNAQLLRKLPADDPRRAALSAELKQIASQMPSTHAQVQNFQNKMNDSNAAVERWKQRHDPGYGAAPSKITTSAPAPSAAPPDAPPPSKTDDGGSTDNGSGDNGLAALKQKEAQQEAATRTLGQQRQAAVNQYLDDPSADNKAAAAALRNQLDGMVDDLNALRGQVDGLEGTSRPTIHVRSAQAISDEHKKLRNSGTNTDGSENQRGGGCGVSPSGNNSSRMYEEVAPGGGSGRGTGRHGHGLSQSRRSGTESKGVSSQSHHHASGTGSHHHATGGTSMPNQQLQAQKFQQNRVSRVQQQQRQFQQQPRRQHRTH